MTHRKVSGCEGARWRRGGRGDRTRDPSVTETHTATPGGPPQSKLLDHKMHNLITGKTCHFSPVTFVRNARALDEPLLRF